MADNKMELARELIEGGGESGGPPLQEAVVQEVQRVVQNARVRGVPLRVAQRATDLAEEFGNDAAVSMLAGWLRAEWVYDPQAEEDA
jgi:hypothetical protein